MKRISAYIVAALMLASCSFKETQYIDFDSIEYTPGMFKAISQNNIDLAMGIPDNTTLPDGTPVNEYIEGCMTDTKATSFGASDFLQNFLKWSTQGNVIEISGIYQSFDDYGKPVTLSGKVVLPKDKPVKRVILVSHYTIGTIAESPSNIFPLEGQLAQMGYAMVIPDYIGYGVTSDRYHPYLMMELTAHNVIDMYRAVKPFLKAIGKEPVYDDIDLMGYSQGGGTTLAVQYMLETQYGPKNNEHIKINTVFAGGGIYDIKATFERFIDTNHASYPVGVPFVIVGQVKGNHLPDEYIDKLLRPEIARNVEEWFLRKKIPTLKINALINTKKTDEILSPLALDRTSTEISELYKCMSKNSVLSLSWKPEAPIYMLHSIDDDTVPFENASRAKERWPEANIQYNFGHYGNHVFCCLRFIYTVKTLLEYE